MVDCPICGKPVNEANINLHLDSGCEAYLEAPTIPPQSIKIEKSTPVASFFRTPLQKKATKPKNDPSVHGVSNDSQANGTGTPSTPVFNKRAVTEQIAGNDAEHSSFESHGDFEGEPPAKRRKPSTALQRAAPLAERMRPRNLDDIYGQELVGPDGVLRGLIEADRVPSMLLWGAAGTGKTTIARVIANMAGGRFVEINSTSSGIGECKKIFADARGELSLTGRKTIIFCDEIHRFSKSQQDVFLGLYPHPGREGVELQQLLISTTHI